MNKKILLISLGIYLLSSITSYAIFSRLGSNVQVIENDPALDQETELGALLNIDPNEPRDQACPLNGALYTQTERNAWEKRRPLAVMIENAPDARPQSGLSKADVVFEAIAEGGVTRFMAMYYCAAQRYDTTIAPVRSARTYFVDWASGFNLPMYVHVGGANTPGPTNALGQINDYGWALQNDINQFSVGYPTFIRNANRLGRQVATEHTMETTSEKLWAVAAERGWTNMTPARTVVGRAGIATDWAEGFTPWQYQDSVPTPGNVSTISHDFWSGYNQYSVRWEYNPENNTYARFMAGEAHLDLNNDVPIEAANVIVLLTNERGPINELKHMLYQTTGTGRALIFKNGEAVDARWSKQTRTDELKFTDARGAAVPLARGLTWISVVSDATKVNY